MFDPPNNPFFPAPQPDYDSPAAAAGLPAPSSVEVPKKKTDKIHPCPYACADKSGQPRFFSCPHNVEQHVREKHTLSRPYKCNLCGDGHRGFNRPFTQNRHMLMMHGIQTGPGKGHGARRTKQRTPAAPVVDDPVDDVQEFDFREYPTQETVQQFPGGGNDDFTYAEYRCRSCDSIFFDRESMLSHLHLQHGEEPSPLCTCMTCSSIYRSDASDAAELTGQLEAGGFGAVDGSQSPALRAPADYGQNYGFTEDTFPMPAKATGGLEGMFAEDLFAPPAFTGGQEVPSKAYGSLTRGDGSLGLAHQELGLQGDYDIGHAAPYGDESGFGGMDFSNPQTGAMDDMDIFQDEGEAASGVKQAEAHDQTLLYSFSSDARMAEAEDIFSQL
ncbi:hypothetical protein LTR36_009926 [Oleoguttula mirabilis]|uniref:C2H2-type domain-containing protein n=1 Tax=Oleoguttula mirabilis TaxID=1507867 RepID=A0AAV9J569_9PEZI|nr:hypothetical protein LTR36_009926 [Oleoguttula mirabilis]